LNITERPALSRLSTLDRWFNRLYGLAVARGFVRGDSRLLESIGLRTGRIYSIPVYRLQVAEKVYLVAPRGETQWVANARAAGSVALRSERDIETYALRELADSEKAVVLQYYLGRYRRTVQRFFDITPDAALSEFATIARAYPVFELILSPRSV
jgi:deazaflavin-dependent oxidoreductase (nitroreductase family)